LITLSTQELLTSIFPSIIFGLFFRFFITFITVVTNSSKGTIGLLSDAIKLKDKPLKELFRFEYTDNLSTSNYILAPLTFLFGMLFSVLSFAFLDGVLRLIPILGVLLGYCFASRLDKAFIRPLSERIVSYTVSLIFIPLLVLLKLCKRIVEKIVVKKEKYRGKSNA